MEVYLIQHGEAKSEAEDPLRALTDKGKEEVLSSAGQFKAMGLKVSKVFHSGKLRAKQTATLFAKELGIKEVKEIKGLAPLDDPNEAKRLIEESKEPLMIVGHLPHLSRLVSSLVIGEPEREVIKFRMAGVVGLSKVEDRWLISCFLPPGPSYNQPLHSSSHF